MRVLVVEDDALLARATERQLTKRGHQVIVVTTGQEAVTALNPVFDVVLCDFQLPDMTGDKIYLAASAEMRERFVFYTGAVDEASKVLNKSCTNKVLEKPAFPGALCEALEGVVRGSDGNESGM
jgi:CheY-like chemotaxis protein